MRKPMLVQLDASAGEARAAAVAALGATAVAGNPDTLVVAPVPGRQPAIETTLVLRATGNDGCELDVRVAGEIDLPFFGWFFRPLSAIARKRTVTYSVECVRAALAGSDPPPPPSTVVGLPPVAFGPEQAKLVATASAATAVVSFAAALFGQLAGPISDTFHASDARISVLLALTRIGALLALFVTALADRRGRRRSILFGVAGSAIACAVSAAAPNLGFFTVAQIAQRGLLITTATVAGISVIEEAPEQARAYAASMLALAGGLGFSLAVVVLPFADIDGWGWRIPFVLGACTIFLVAPIARELSETSRYTALAARVDVVRGRARDVVSRHRRRFWLLGVAAFLTNVFSAPSSQLMNKYLIDDRGFSNTGVAIFRTVTSAVPGLVGLLVGGRLAETRGRRSVAVLALAVATSTQMVFFLFGGPVIWFMSAASILAASAAGIALGTLEVELFPTEVRSTSNAMLSVVAVMGSGAGFGIAGALSDPLGGLGRAIAITGVGALIAAFAVLPLLPESAAQTLDDVSPTTPGEYGPAP